jgi:hypothetical protein
MKKTIAATFFAVVAIVGLSMLSPTAQAGDDKCKSKTFKTELVKAACEKGGQKEAKAVMKTFMKEKKFKSCNACHSKLAPNYELKTDALKQFNDAGGK